MADVQSDQDFAREILRHIEHEYDAERAHEAANRNELLAVGWSCWFGRLHGWCCYQDEECGDFRGLLADPQSAAP